MTRYEFLEGLKEALLDAPADIRQENLQYYSSYIEGEIGKGRSEAAVLEELGEPSWIANSILEAAAGDTSADVVSYEYDETPITDRIFEEHAEPVQDDDVFMASVNGRTIYLKKWMVIALCTAIAILLLLILGLVFSAVFRVLIWLLTNPFFWIVVVALLLTGYIRSR